jgi:hypothetical protein
MRTALLELYMLYGPRHLGYWLNELNCVVSLTALRQTQVKTLLATIHVRLLVAMEILFIGVLLGYQFA